MQRLLLKNKRLLMLLLGSTAAILNFACSTTGAPPPPTIEIYMHDASSDTALCSRTDLTKCNAVNMASTDGWFMLRPSGWEANENYIDTLICVIDGGCKTTTLMIVPDQIGMEVMAATKSGARQDLERVKARLIKIKQNLKQQKRNK